MEPSLTRFRLKTVFLILATIGTGTIVACFGKKIRDDPLESFVSGMPALLVERPPARIKYFENPITTCQECHPQHVAEWKISNHAYAAIDPVFLAMNKLGQEKTKGKLDQFCIQCHLPTAMANGLTPVTKDADGVHQQDLSDLDPVSKHGVSCDVCHSVTLVMGHENAKLAYNPDGIKRGSIKDPIETDAHSSLFSPLFKESEICAPCHAVTNPKGAKVEETFQEWEASSFKKKGQTCQTCHMPEKIGQAAIDGPERTIHDHHFVGVDVSLLPEEDFPGYHEMREMTANLLRKAARTELVYLNEEQKLEITITNLAGHALPSGATAERQMWIELIVIDSSEQSIVFETGTLDPNTQDLRDGELSHDQSPENQDPFLVRYGQDFLKVPGLPKPENTIVTFPWEAGDVYNNLIAADGSDTRGFSMADLPTGNYLAKFRLLFRTFPPYFLRKLEAEAGLDPEVKNRLPTVVMAEQELLFTK